MAHAVGNVKFISNKQWKFSSSVSKNGIFVCNGRSVSIFRISTDDCINPWFNLF